MFQIEDSVPVPAKNNRCFRYPFNQMEVGYSFVISNANDRRVASCRSSAARFGRLNDRKYIVRKDDEGLYRCWRVE